LDAMNPRTTPAILAELDQQLQSLKAELEAAGLRIDGHSGKSKEGPIWQFHFRKTWPVPPDEASVAILIWWAEWPEPEQVHITRLADIYRQGQLSHFKDKAERSVSVESFIAEGVWPIVEAGIEEGRLLVEEASNKAFNPTSLPPLRGVRSAG